MDVQRETQGANGRFWHSSWCMTILTRVVGVMQTVCPPTSCVAEGWCRLTKGAVEEI